MRPLFPKLLLLLTAALISAPASLAIDFFFAPDTSTGEIGQTVLLSGRIGPSDLMRGFTVYMAYDTNVIDLSEPPVPGALIADRQGLQFNYFDHVAIHPDRLEIGGTVFGSDFWAGPGELFQMRMLLRSCADAPITSAGAPFFVDANGNYPAVTFHPAVVLVCARIPAAVSALTIHPVSNSVILRWPAVTTDYLGRPLFTSPSYAIYRQQILPNELPPENIGITNTTLYVDPLNTGASYSYYLITLTTP